MSVVSDVMKTIKPTTIIVITPHGIATDEHLGIYLNHEAEGLIAFKEHEYPRRLQFRINIDLASALHQKALSLGFKVTRIVTGVFSGKGLLQWGELVPLHYTAFQITPRPKIVVISTPLKRYENLDDLAPQLVSFGRFLGDFMETTDENIALVVSGDLSHVHDPNGPYGFHESCTIFDKIIVSWLNGKDDNLLINEGLEIDKTAKSCGLAPLLILQGVLEKKKPVSRKVLEYRVPTYFGMAISTFTF